MPPCEACCFPCHMLLFCCLLHCRCCLTKDTSADRTPLLSFASRPDVVLPTGGFRLHPLSLLASCMMLFKRLHVSKAG